MNERRQVVEATFANQTPNRVPVGFWYHFTAFNEHCRGLQDPSIVRRVIDGHKAMYDDLQPDMLKIMSDGFFGHPSMNGKKFETAEDLKQIQSVGAQHPWIREQVNMVREIMEYTKHEVPTFYSIFSPLQAIRLYFFEDENAPDKFTRLFFENPDLMVQAAQAIEKDVLLLVDALMKETDIDGVYYSTQEVQDDRADRVFHEKYVRDTDVSVMNRIHEYGSKILLHICGWGEFTNTLELYRDYPADIVNWATHTEQVSLKEGKKLFHNKPVVGGFDNNPGTLLYSGSDEEIRAYLYELLDESGTEGIMIGADCTVDPSVGHDRLRYVRDVVRAYCQGK